MEENIKKLNLKTIIPVAIAIIVILAVGIVLSANEDVILTNDNYKQYLKITSTATGSDQYTTQLGINYINNSNKSKQPEEYKSIYMSCGAKGLSSNYVYEDVEITIHFYGTLPLRELKNNGIYNNTYTVVEPTFSETGEKVKIDKTITIKCDSSGNVISNSGNSYVEKAKEKNYFSEADIKNIKQDISVKGKIKEIK